MKTGSDKSMVRSEKGSILIFAVVVLMFFASLAVFLRGAFDPQEVIDAKEAEQVTRADIVIASGFDALAAAVNEDVGDVSELYDEGIGEAADVFLQALNNVSELILEDKDGKVFGRISTEKRFVATDLIFNIKENGVWVTTFYPVTWYIELADGTQLKRRKKLNLYFRIEK